MVSKYLPNRLTTCCVCVLILIEAFSAACVFAANPKTKEGNAKYSEAKLCELASKGQITDELISEFYKYAQAKAKKQIKAPNEFWNWLGKNKELQQGLLVGLHPGYNPHVITTLRGLRKKFGAEVELYPHLALAFSFVYGAAKGKTIRAPWVGWVAKNRPVPACNDSFAYYLKNKDKMLFPLDRLQWPLMLYVADNDVPLSERQWVLDRYKDHSLDSLVDLHNEPEYVTGAHAKKRAKLEGTPMALPRIISDGGVSSQLSYYANRTLKCLGVPSVRLLGRAHAFEGWVAGDEKLKTIVGADYGGRKDGTFFCPLARNIHKEYEFKLLVAAIDLSYEGYLKSKIACHVFKIVPNDSKKNAMRLLKAAIKNNPYALDPWFEYTQGCENGVLPFEAGWVLYDRANSTLGDHPELFCDILNKLSSADVPEDQNSQLRSKFKKTIALLREKDRLDLAVTVFDVYAKYLVKTRGIQTAINNSLAWFTVKNFSPYHQEKLFTLMHNTALKSKDDKILEKLLKSEYRRRLILTRKSSKELYANNYSSYAQVAKAYISYHKKTGNPTKASEIYLELDKYNNENNKLSDLQDAITQGTALGAVDEQVTKITPNVRGCHVWRILYDLPKGMNIRLRAKHAAAGKNGAFYFAAWSDTDADGVPDTKIENSPLMIAGNKGEWSNWQFVSAGRTVFVGMATKPKVSLYYQMGGELEGYFGLSDRVFYSRVFDGKPQSCIQPRYANIRVEILGK